MSTDLLDRDRPSIPLGGRTEHGPEPTPRLANEDEPDTPASALIARLVAIVFFLQLLDSTIIATSLPAMADSFDTDAVSMSIGFTAYMVAMAIFIPPSGWLAERFGARPVLLTAIAVFAISSLGCGLTDSLGSFVAWRTLQGASAALMAPVGRVLVLSHTPKAKLMSAIATITWPALFAPVLGPVLGGWITGHLGWRWNFLLNLPIALAAFVLFVLLVPRRAGNPSRRFDLAGFLLSAAALALILAGLETVTHDGLDSHGWIAVTAIAVGLVTAVFAVRHMRAESGRLLDLGVLALPTFAKSALWVGSLGRIAINATPFLLPLLLQVGYGYGPLEAGHLLLVYFAGNLGMKAITTPIMRRFGFRRVLVANGLAASASVAAFAAMEPRAALVWTYALLLFAGMTRSLQFTALNTLAFAEISAEQRSAATTLASMTQQLAMLLAVALAILLARLFEPLAGPLGAPAPFQAAFLGMGLVGTVSAFMFLGLSPNAGHEVSGQAQPR